ncbi:hypothetical protein CXB51_025331 [Gossypium anomalum]|uniref:TIR domain-containing protein n=1 Tax=Gossypium anomalum TaxID=47600 RepID=A0A8J5Y965_9ROSI|nr:hypothetical protein CXB51_025331 [Gossypium anomalum]
MTTSSSSSRQIKHQVFLSFRGEDTRLNFTSHLLKALKDMGVNVFFDEEKLEKGELLSKALSEAIAASNLSIIVLSVDYASSKSCLAEVSDIIDRKNTQGHIVLPIFYHVDPSHVRNIGGSFRISFEEHESKRLVDEVKRWKAAFAEVGKLKGWHIDGGKFDRPEAEYIKNIIEYVTEKLTNSNPKSASEELVGLDYQKNTILRLIERKDCRAIGLWGIGGITKTPLVDDVHKEVSPKSGDCNDFHQNVSENIEKQEVRSLRNDLFSKILNEEICIDTLLIGPSFIQEKLNNKEGFKWKQDRVFTGIVTLQIGKWNTSLPIKQNPHMLLLMPFQAKGNDNEGNRNAESIMLDEQILQRDLQITVEEENYAEAAKIKDDLRVLHEDSKALVLIANFGFYDAFRRGDLDMMQNLWVKGDDVCCVHPGGKGISGYDSIMKSWKLVWMNFEFPLEIKLKNVRVHVRGDFGYVTCVESVKTTKGSNWFPLFVTNVFEMINGQWHICIHQSS